MRSALLILAAVAFVAALGGALCVGMGWPVRPGLVLAAAAGALVAAGAALVPLLLARGATQASVAQAGLVGTVVHLFGCLAGAAVLLLVLKQGAAAAYWMLAFYWATLAALVVESARAVKAAPTAAHPTVDKQ